MLGKIVHIQKRYEYIKELINHDSIDCNTNKYKCIRKECSSLEELLKMYNEYVHLCVNIKSTESLITTNDKTLNDLIITEIALLNESKDKIVNKLLEYILPKDNFDKRNAILEIRAGTGGDEAAIFVANLFRMYMRYSEKRNWKNDILSSSSTGRGGFKEIITLIEGNNAYSKLRYESGVHRVQRVPTTETQGRIHTSAITVAVLPEASDIEIIIDDKEIVIDVFRSSGPGGQSVNTTDSAVRITHRPTGIVVTCQDEKSQHKNKSKAMKVLKARLLEYEKKKQHDNIAGTRKNMIGSGDRSERIRTYNFPQGRVTDHRIGLTLYKLTEIIDGEIDQIIDPIRMHYLSENFFNVDHLL
ncbi:MAG: peptide chain release factor 1 [Bdellovibrionales bacterium RIFOXYB2_FULL_36_6]|nr:MAG: peptide chain release factor 1 [Bdellovibrionales bacterium RIFOXYB2_FULL_36_6]